MKFLYFLFNSDLYFFKIMHNKLYFKYNIQLYYYLHLEDNR